MRKNTHKIRIKKFIYKKNPSIKLWADIVSIPIIYVNTAVIEIMEEVHLSFNDSTVYNVMTIGRVEIIVSKYVIMPIEIKTMRIEIVSKFKNIDASIKLYML